MGDRRIDKTFTDGESARMNSASSIELPLSDESKFARSEMLRRVLLLGGALAASELAFVGLPKISASSPTSKQDKAIFGFMLLLEEIQTAFYTKALSSAGLQGEALQFAQTVGAQEHAHLQYLEREHGAPKPKIPAIHFGAAAMTAGGFLSAAVTLEEVGLGAYNGQAPNLTANALRRAGRIISVEARHVAWARSLAGELPAPTASDVPLTNAEALSQIKERGYVSE